MGNSIEVVECTGLSSSHVVWLTVVVQLRPELQESDEKDDLELRGKRKSVPLFWRGQVSGRMGHSGCSQRPRENEVGLDDVSNEGGHSNTTMFDFRLTKPTDGCFLTLSANAELRPQNAPLLVEDTVSKKIVERVLQQSNDKL